MDDLKAHTQFDGIWLDLNEAYSKCDGECPPAEQLSVSRLLHGPWLGLSRDNEYFDLQFEVDNLPFNKSSLNPDAKHVGDENSIEYNLHNLYGHLQVKKTQELLAKDLKRPFILTRSTFSGTG